MNDNYNLGNVIWSSNYQKYIVVIGYNKDTNKYVVDNHKIMEMSSNELDMFRNKKYDIVNDNNMEIIDEN